MTQMPGSQPGQPSGDPWSSNPYQPQPGPASPQSPYAAGQPQSPYGAGQPASPYGAGQQQSPYGGGQQQPQSPYGTGQPASPYGTGQPASPYGAEQPQYGAGQAQPQYGATQQQSPYGGSYQPAGGGYSGQGWGGQQPGYPGGPVPPVKKSRTGLIVLIILLPLLLIGGGVTATILILNKADHTITDITKKTATPFPTGTSTGTPTDTPSTATTTKGSSTASKPPADKVFQIGNTVRLTSTSGTQVQFTLTNAVVAGKDIVVTVDIEGIAGSMPYNPMYFTFVGPDLTEYDVNLFSSVDTPLHSGTVTSGQKIHGKVGFTAPSSALHGGMVELTDPLFQPIAYWSVP